MKQNWPRDMWDPHRLRPSLRDRRLSGQALAPLVKTLGFGITASECLVRSGPYQTFGHIDIVLVARYDPPLVPSSCTEITE